MQRKHMSCEEAVEFAYQGRKSWSKLAMAFMGVGITGYAGGLLSVMAHVSLDSDISFGGVIISSIVGYIAANHKCKSERREFLGNPEMYVEKYAGKVLTGDSSEIERLNFWKPV